MHHVIGWLVYLGIGVQDRSRYTNIVSVLNTIGLLMMLAGGCCFFVIVLALAVLPSNIFTGVTAPLTFVIFILGTIIFGATRGYP